MNPLLLDFPEEFETERLLIRAPRPGDGAEIQAAIVESAERLKPWMPWATPIPTVEDEEENVRRARARFLTREDMWFLLYLKGTSTFVGGSGFPRINWSVPKFEIGYWVRTRFEGQGYVAEAVEGLTRFAFDALQAHRIEIRMDERNERSWRVAERAGYTLEGTLRNDTRDVAGHLRNTRIYSKIRMD
ncbi:MAG: GNAT family N-acetyltransferase [Anaerolineae bacterium]